MRLIKIEKGKTSEAGNDFVFILLLKIEFIITSSKYISGRDSTIMLFIFLVFCLYKLFDTY